MKEALLYKNMALKIALDALSDFDYNKRLDAIQIVKKALDYIPHEIVDITQIPQQDSSK